MEGAHSTEFLEELPAEAAKDLHFPVVDYMPEQEDVTEKGGSMRLGSYPCKIMDKTLAMAAYGEPVVYERHRHRFEVNNAFRERLTEAGLITSGVSPDERLVEMIELPEHPWFVATQGHPEFKSRPARCHPLFRDFVRAAIAHHDAQ
jgi:CTP synthase